VLLTFTIGGNPRFAQLASISAISSSSVTSTSLVGVIGKTSLILFEAFDDDCEGLIKT